MKALVMTVVVAVTCLLTLLLSEVKVMPDCRSDNDAESCPFQERNKCVRAWNQLTEHAEHAAATEGLPVGHAE